MRLSEVVVRLLFVAFLLLLGACGKENQSVQHGCQYFDVNSGKCADLSKV